jgi:Cu(I)/Ag(I) efflux system periplasmic protein CusF
MKFFTPLLLTCLLSANAMAQTATESAAPTTASSSAPMSDKKMTEKPMADAPTATKDMAEGEVRKIDKEAKKVTLKHGPIKNLDMPGMTMVFQVRDPALLDKLVAGEKIMFTAEQLQGAMVITSVEKATKP